MKNVLNWPGIYEPSIKIFLQNVPQIKKLLHGFDIYEAYIFGGFLRYIVEQVSAKKLPSIDDFINYGGDIDIYITAKKSEYPKLERNFDTVIRDGCLIEYAGVKYGCSELSSLDFDVSKWKSKKNEKLPHGNYIVWIPFDGKNYNIEKNVHEEIHVKEKNSYVDMVKIHRPENTKKVFDEIFQCKKWLKIDVIYGESKARNDFTVNELFWPCKPNQNMKRSVKDIIERRIVFSDRTYQCSKMLYRLVKLLRRGYKLPFDMYDSQFISHYLRAEDYLSSYGFTCDMSCPSLKSGNRLQIQTTKHPLTLFDKEYIESLSEYKQLNSSPKIPVSLLSTNKIDKVPTNARVYKSAQLCTADKIEYTCVLALNIKKGTRYVSNESVGGFRFENAEIADIYGYLNTSILEKIDQDFQVLSFFDYEYLYYDSNVPENKIVYAKNHRNNIVVIESNNNYGIYAYTTLMEAWEHSCFDNYVFAEDFS